MKKEKKPNKVRVSTFNQHGITLIALVIMIIILVIIAAIVIRAVTGDNNLIGSTTNAAENYKIAEYKEMISAEITSCIQNNMLKGESTSIGDIANWLSDKTEWTKKATPYDETSDVLIKVTEGYVFQSYYNSTYGVYYVEYIGKGEEADFPKLVGTYNRSNQEIEGKASGGTGEIEYIEIYHKGEKIGESETSSPSTINKKITKPGWYTLKTETSKNKIRYAWVRVESLTGALRKPSINVVERTSRK